MSGQSDLGSNYRKTGLIRCGSGVLRQALTSTIPTVKAWLHHLEASYVVFTVAPYYENFGKRLVKSPKLYFTDTG